MFKYFLFKKEVDSYYIKFIGFTRKGSLCSLGSFLHNRAIALARLGQSKHI